MAAISVTLNGVICDLYGRTITGPVKIVGELMYSDRGVGGGPMPPGEGSAGDAHPEHPIYYPPHIWGPTDPRPTHPISGIPGLPGYEPPPIDQPPPTGEPGEDGFIKPPPEGGGWGYHPQYGWMLDPREGQPGPK